MKIVVVGEPHFVRFWELIGAEGITVESDVELLKKVSELIEVENIGILIVPERLSGKIVKMREKLLKEGIITPIFAFMPDKLDREGQRIDELKKLISLAMGIELKL